MTYDMLLDMVWSAQRVELAQVTNPEKEVVNQHSQHEDSQ